MRSNIIVELNVGKGDTLESLAEMYQIPFEKILAANEGMQACTPTSANAMSLLQIKHSPFAKCLHISCRFG